MTDADLTLFAAKGKNGYMVRVLGYLFNQKRIQLIDTKRPDLMSPGEGTIVREMCTYDDKRAISVVNALADADDPEAVAETYAKPFNCEYKGGRIRLDNKDGDR